DAAAASSTNAFTFRAEGPSCCSVSTGDIPPIPSVVDRSKTLAYAPWYRFFRSESGLQSIAGLARRRATDTAMALHHDSDPERSDDHHQQRLQLRGGES